VTRPNEAHAAGGAECCAARARPVLTARRTAAPAPLIGAAADAQTVSGTERNNDTIDHEDGRIRSLSQTLEQIRALVARGEVRVSVHGYEELAADRVLVHEVVEGLADAVVVEDYPDYAKGPCVLVLERDKAGEPVHVVWGVPKGQTSPAVLVTAYRPDPAKWDQTWQKRRT
jgi:uncharacterized protein DUF4258